MGLPPSAVPSFPVPMNRNFRPAEVVVDAGKVWTASNGQMYAKFACARDPVQDHPASQLSGHGLKITTPVKMIIARSSGSGCFGQAHDVKSAPEY